ncbi:putative fatty acyl-CoA reductase CG5065 [Chironomus tepperi]|uniref:putative fatty acyl-CoA reductase CG5065 n=1 Tax=Chironomus tepperi TaxID=113505 RepID=UPI00391EECA6
MITIPEFYNNRDIFITGGSGFVGKVLIEKLLRSCSEIELFSGLMETDPKVFNKLVPIEGDVTVIGLGLTDESRAILKDVSVIFHSAASVRFDENYKTAIILNTKGTHEVIKFALTLDNLVSFVHVSTTYCYPDRQFIDEKLYTVPGDWQETIKIVEKIDDELLEYFMPIYNNFKPNSYVYAKALAEHVCESYKNQIPICIVRPSIVVGTELEPIGGWCDNFNGPVGLLTACGLGIMRTMYASNKALLNCVAVDVVAKTLIVAGWKTAIDNGLQSAMTLGESAKVEVNENCEQLQVYNCASTHNMDLELLVYDGQYRIRKYPFEKCVYLPGGGVTLCKVMNYFRIACFQLAPAVLVDQALILKGKKPMLMSLQRKIAAASVALRNFVFTEWEFGTKNFKNLEKIILAEDL